MRQHVNPLSKFFQLHLELPPPQDLFEDDSLPIHLDIGSARGMFLIQLASNKLNWNHLGVEIRNKLVVSAERERKQLQNKNLKFLFCNANVSLRKWLLQLRCNQLKIVSINFPDPWFKRRHYKRRVLQPSLLFALAKSLSPGSKLFIQSDILEVAESMTSIIEKSQCFEKGESQNCFFMETNQFNIRTERENYAIRNNLTIYKELYYRNHISVAESDFLMQMHDD